MKCPKMLFVKKTENVYYNFVRIAVIKGINPKGIKKFKQDVFVCEEVE